MLDYSVLWQKDIQKHLKVNHEEKLKLNKRNKKMNNLKWCITHHFIAVNSIFHLFTVRQSKHKKF